MNSRRLKRLNNVCLTGSTTATHPIQNAYRGQGVCDLFRSPAGDPWNAPPGTWQNRAHGAACPQLARADVRAADEGFGF
jgi:hypothetical protein